MAFLIGLLAACAVASPGAYWVHRMQHWNVIKGAAHREHHRDNECRGILREYWSYVRDSAVVVVATTTAWYFLFAPAVAIGWLTGALGYMAFTAFSHEAQHTNPHLIFWSEPQHYIHHNLTPRHNFGFSSSVWDKVFGTYKGIRWTREPVRWREYLRIKWL